MSTPALSLESIAKRFGPTKALDGASLTVARGTVHALLGENGAGKTTLMRIAFGLERPDAGDVQIDGQTVVLRSAADAIARGVGMVQQHFSLVPAMTVAENIALGRRGPFHPRRATHDAQTLSQQTSLDVDPTARAGDLTAAAQQKLELLKLFSRRARTLILDEPTAVLAPAEARELMASLRRVASEGGAVVLVTHKLREALAAADEVTVMRRGRTMLTAPARSISETELARAMFPEGISPDTPGAPQPTGRAIAELRDAELRDRRGITRVRGATLVVREREIVGIAGVEGSGHHELLLALAGRIIPVSGEARVPADNAFVPEHRQRDALVAEFSAMENIALHRAAQARGRLNWREIGARTQELLRRYAIRAESVSAPVRTLSGGNQQKLVLARELDNAPALVVAENPTQGLDVRAAMAVRARLREARDAGAGVVVYASDLDELLALADRVVVMFAGTLREVARDAEEIGRAMLGAMS